MERKTRMQELDGLRGLAVLSVMLFHYTGPREWQTAPSDRAAVYWSLGHYGVELFFAISGFVIFMTLDKTSRAADFAVSRFSRLYPVYWVAALITFAAVSVFGLAGKEVSGADALFNLTMLQGFVGVPAIDGVYWTLAVELGFYGLVFALYCLRLLPRIETVAVGWLALIAGNAALFESGSHLPGIAVRLLCLDFGNLFIAGILFYRSRKDGFTATRHAMIVACVLIPAAFQSLEAVAAAALVVGAFYLFAVGRLGFAGWRPLVLLGWISYALYLVHANIGLIVIRELQERSVNVHLAIMAAICVSLGLATVLTIGVERPAMRAIRSAYQPRRERPVTGSRRHRLVGPQPERDRRPSG